MTPAAAGLARANREIHQILDQLTKLEEAKAHWVGYRGTLRETAPRAAKVTSPSVGVPESELGSQVPQVQAIAGTAAGTVAADASPIPWPGEPRRADGAQGGVPAQAVVAPKREGMSAAAFLGIAGAALMIVTSIVFVGAAWATSAPAVRDLIVFVIAAVFAVGSVVITRKSLSIIGGAVGVVAVGYIAVGVIGLSESLGVSKGVFTAATLAACLAGLGLSRLKVRAVGILAAIAALILPHALAFDVSRVVVAEAWGGVYSLTASTLAVGLAAVAFAWRSKVERSIVVGGAVVTLALVGVVAIVATYFNVEANLWLVVAVLAPLVGSLLMGFKTPLRAVGLVTVMAPAGIGVIAQMVTHSVGAGVLIGLAVAIGILVATAYVPASWRDIALACLTPIGLLLLSLAGGLFVGLVGTIFGGDSGEVEWLYATAALLMSALAVLVTRLQALRKFALGFTPVLLLSLVGLVEGLAAGAAAMGDSRAHWAGAVFAAGAVGMALAAPLWGQPHVRPVRISAAAMGAASGLISFVVLMITPARHLDVALVTSLLASVLAVAALAFFELKQSAVTLAVLIPLLTLAATWQLGGSWTTAAAAAAVSAAAVAGLVRFLPAKLRAPVYMGSLPSLGVLWLTVGSLALAAFLAGPGNRSLSVWALVVLASALAHTLVLPSVKGWRLGVVAVSVALVGLGLPTLAGWVVPISLGLFASVLTVALPRRNVPGPWWGPSVAVASLAWSAGETGPRAIVLGVLTAIGFIFVSARKGEGLSRSSVGRAVVSVSTLATPLLGGLTVGHGLWLAGVEWSLLAAISVGLALAIAVGFLFAGVDENSVPIVAIGIITVIGPFTTGKAAVAGTVVLLGGVAWLMVRLRGNRWALWSTLASPTIAVMLFAASLGITEVEAYTAVPAATLLGLGLWWMWRDPSMSSLVGMGPGLLLAAAPSCMVMLASPDAAERPVSMAFLAAAMAAAGLLARWRSPLIATAVVAIAIGLSQGFADRDLVIRWVSFGSAGLVLLILGLAAEGMKKLR